MTPNREGLEKGKTYRYTKFPPKLEKDLFYPVREVKALVQETSAHKVLRLIADAVKLPSRPIEAANCVLWLPI